MVKGNVALRLQVQFQNHPGKMMESSGNVESVIVSGEEKEKT